MFLVLVGFVVSRKMGQIDPEMVLTALKSIPSDDILSGAAVTIVSYGILTLFDGLGLKYLHQPLSAGRVIFSSFISYAFNFNFGSLLGAVAMRYRLYRHWGLSYLTITQLMAFCIVTSWFGYFAVAGLTLSLFPRNLKEMPLPSWFNPRFVGIAMLALLVVVLLLFMTRESIRVLGYHIRSPSRPILLAQLCASSFQWLLQPLLIFILLNAFQPTGFNAVLMTYLTASVLALLAHIPAGLGVIEGTFLLAFDTHMPSEDILAAMVAYRVLYFFGPLALATLLFIVFSLIQKPSRGMEADKWTISSPKQLL